MEPNPPADPASASNPVTTTHTAAPGAGATGHKFGSPTACGKRVATVIEKGRNLPASARLAKTLTEHDDLKKYYSGRQHDLRVLAYEAGQLIKTERFSPTVERFVNHDHPTQLPEGFVVEAAVEKDVREVDTLLDEIVGEVADVSAEIEQTQLKPLADIVAVVQKYGKTKVGKVFIALQPPPPAPVLPSLDL